MSQFIENNSTHGDIIIMTAQGQATTGEITDTSDSRYNFLRSLRLDKLKNCTLLSGF